MNILNEENAIRIVLKYLNMIPEQIRLINRNRYALIKTKSGEWIALVLKTEPFFNFGNRFREFGETGVGDSINCKSLRLMIRYGVRTIYSVFRDGKIYSIPIDTILQKSYRWTQKEGTEVRSFSIHHYKRVKMVI